MAALVLVALVVVGLPGSAYVVTAVVLPAVRNLILTQMYGDMIFTRPPTPLTAADVPRAAGPQRGANPEGGRASGPLRAIQRPISASRSPRPSSISAAGGVGVHGTVRFAGPVARNPRIPLEADPSCLEAGADEPATQEAVVVNPNGTLKNVFVHLDGSFPAAPPAPSELVVVDQRGCIYRPRVVAARVGQTLSITNSDATFHNVHGDGTHTFDVGQPRTGMRFGLELKAVEILHLRCNIHPWMKAFVAVVDHPYFAITGDDGAFHIDDVPPGRYTLQAWHERYGSLSQVVNAEAGGSVKVDFIYDETGTLAPPRD